MKTLQAGLESLEQGAGFAEISPSKLEKIEMIVSQLNNQPDRSQEESAPDCVSRNFFVKSLERVEETRGGKRY